MTVPPGIATLLRAYATRVPAMGIAGSYVAGSVALGAFDAETSDVDVVTLVSGVPDLARIRGLHADLARAHPAARRLEAIYVPVAGGPGVRIDRGRWRGAGRLTAVARSEVRSGGIVLVGALDRIEAPTRAELDAEMAWNLDVYWAGRRARPALFLFTPWVDFAVTTLARIAWTRTHGTVIDKRTAARWLAGVMPSSAPLVEGRIAGRLRRARAVQRLIDDVRAL